MKSNVLFFLCAYIIEACHIGYSGKVSPLVAQMLREGGNLVAAEGATRSVYLTVYSPV